MLRAGVSQQRAHLVRALCGQHWHAFVLCRAAFTITPHIRVRAPPWARVIAAAACCCAWLVHARAAHTPPTLHLLMALLLLSRSSSGRWLPWPQRAPWCRARVAWLLPLHMLCATSSMVGLESPAAVVADGPVAGSQSRATCERGSMLGANTVMSGVCLKHECLCGLLQRCCFFPAPVLAVFHATGAAIHIRVGSCRIHGRPAAVHRVCFLCPCESVFERGVQGLLVCFLSARCQPVCWCPFHGGVVPACARQHAMPMAAQHAVLGRLKQGRRRRCACVRVVGGLR